MRKVTVADLILPSAFGKNISLNTILAPGDRNLNKSILQSLNHRRVAGGGGGRDVEASNKSTHKS